MKKLNFSSNYEADLRSGDKTTTVRLHNGADLRAGECVELAINGPDDTVRPLGETRITQVYEKTLAGLDTRDLQGEAPACRAPAALKAVLEAIYQRTLHDTQRVVIIKFEPLR